MTEKSKELLAVEDKLKKTEKSFKDKLDVLSDEVRKFLDELVELKTKEKLLLAGVSEEQYAKASEIEGHLVITREDLANDVAHEITEFVNLAMLSETEGDQLFSHIEYRLKERFMELEEKLLGRKD